MILLVVGPGPGSLRAPEVARELSSAGHEVEVFLEPRARLFAGPAAFATVARVVGVPTAAPEAAVFAPATAATLARLARAWGRGLPFDVAAGVPRWSRPSSTRPPPRTPPCGRTWRCWRRTASASSAAPAGRWPRPWGGRRPAERDGRAALRHAGLDHGRGTREPIDRVRVVSNRSSGKMGRAVAREAWRRGAGVTVVAANVEGAEPGSPGSRSRPTRSSRRRPCASRPRPMP
ncbi:hypothetical protein GBA65_10330 [Rubrobacter marinus]|uniref:Uncharacterized protein n=1 Tax=Rubrobacter marinus TaxID=2653852 RepID=A0A6G8PXA4_9ACTN|nr:hypothetical protein GBA65_10330 [Rubrobacter marinus]